MGRRIKRNCRRKCVKEMGKTRREVTREEREEGFNTAHDEILHCKNVFGV